MGIFRILAVCILFSVFFSFNISAAIQVECDVFSFRRPIKDGPWKDHMHEIAKIPLLASGKAEELLVHYSKLYKRLSYLAFSNDSVSSEVIEILLEFSEDKGGNFVKYLSFSNSQTQKIAELRVIVQDILPKIISLRESNKADISLVLNGKTLSPEIAGIWENVDKRKIRIAQLLSKAKLRPRWIASIIEKKIGNNEFLRNTQSSQSYEDRSSYFSKEIREQIELVGLPLRRLFADSKELIVIKEQLLEIENRVIGGNLRWIVKRVNYYNRLYHYCFDDEDLMDLASAGSDGVLRAFTKFESSYDVKFLTYASWWINKRIRAEIKVKKKQASIGTNRSIKNKIRRAFRKLSQSLSRSPNQFEIAQETGLTELDLQKYNVETRFFIPFSLARELTESGKPDRSMSLADTLSAPVDRRLEETNKALLQRLESALSVLEKKSQTLLRMRFGLFPYNAPMTLDKAGAKLKISRDSARRIINRSLETIRRKYLTDNLSLEDIKILPSDLVD